MIDSRIDEIIEAVIEAASGSYSAQLSLSDENDKLDTLAKVVNTVIVKLKEKEEGLKQTEKKLKTISDNYFWQSEELKARNEEFETYSNLLLKQKIELEKRTADLVEANKQLHVEIFNREKAAEAQQTAYDQAIIYAEQLKEQIEERSRAEKEKEKLEAQLQQAQKMEAVGTLAGGIAHDFNNILQAISGYVQLLLMKKEIKDTNRHYLKQIDKSSRKAAELTKQLLIFGGKLESKLRPLSLNQEIIEICKLFQRTIPKMIHIELHLAEDLKFINADPVQIEQIMMNLGVNARDAMPDGGKLTFETKNVVLDEAYCRTHVDVVPGEYVLLRISDTGHGMDRETLEHIFEPFYTTKEIGKGTGLGLAIVYGFVESHRGHIMCYSEAGQGTDFKIHFPALAMGAVEQELELKEEAVIRGGHETVLIVDDEEVLRDQGRDMLNKYGYTTITAESGERAIEIYKKEKDRIDLVILDIGMPGMGGYKCLEQLIKVDPTIKVIIASGYASSGRVEEMLKSGAADFIGKPCRLTDMLKKVRELLDQV